MNAADGVDECLQDCVGFLRFKMFKDEIKIIGENPACGPLTGVAEYIKEGSFNWLSGA